MSYKIIYTEKVEEDLRNHTKSGNKSLLRKIDALLDELEEHPRSGTGKPKQLTGDLSGFWSRRITAEHRMIYSIHDNVVVVEVISIKGHYYDK